MPTQIRLAPKGCWHRRKPDDARHTACGLVIPGAFSTRDSSLEGDLCLTCFTRHELDTGEMKKIERAALASLDDDESFNGITPTDVIIEKDDD